ncbi:MAG: DUF4159 domain-containing protein [Myxococcales bacterium]|nr:DUF4159 domain-containing protein [Myxococcales bacterium]
MSYVGHRTSHRRALLRQAVTLGGFGSLLMGFKPSASDLQVAQLRTEGDWDARPDALRRLAWEVRQRTSIKVNLEKVLVDPASPELFRYPLVYLGGSGEIPPFSEDSIRALRRFLTYGGSLLVDSADAEPGGAFDASVRRLLGNLFPRRRLDRIPSEHVLYKTFYLVTHQAGRVLRVPYMEGLTLENRYAVVYCQNDLAGAWSRDPFGRWTHDVSPGGERQREMAFRLGINIVMYVLCLDYKDDLVHAPFILDRRR